MATIKHTSSKNSDLSAAERYLIFQHNEYTGLPILDKHGQPKLRENYLLDTLECGENTFAMACLLANRKYGKNAQSGDVKTHHYIISFDPRDATDNGLTLERAQVLGLQFCKENFPGHPAIVCATRMATTERETSMFTSSLAVCVSEKSNASPTWKSPATGRRAASTAARRPCCGISAPKSWSFAKALVSIKSTC